MQFGMRFRREDAADKVNDRFWHEIEGTALEEVRRIQEERLRAQMAYLKTNSTFYQEKFAEAQIERIIDLLRRTGIGVCLSTSPNFVSSLFLLRV